MSIDDRSERVCRISCLYYLRIILNCCVMRYRTRPLIILFLAVVLFIRRFEITRFIMTSGGGWGGGENATLHGELIKTREFCRQNVTNWVRVHRHRAIDGVRMTYEWWRWCVNNDIIMLKFVFPNNAENVSQRRALEKKKKNLNRCQKRKSEVYLHAVLWRIQLLLFCLIRILTFYF